MDNDFSKFDFNMDSDMVDDKMTQENNMTQESNMTQENADFQNSNSMDNDDTIHLSGIENSIDHEDSNAKQVSSGGNGSSEGNISSGNQPPYYKESFKKTRSNKRVNLLQLIIVALISSILGGAIVFASFTYLAPAIQPSINSFIAGNLTENNSNNNGSQDLDSYKKVVIEASDTPITAIFEKVSPSVVGIRVTGIAQNFLMGGARQGEGSGVIIKEDGYIMTNNHVIEAALDQRTGKLASGAKIEVFLNGKQDKAYQATVIGRDSTSDLAVIKIDAKGLVAAELGESSEVKVGELAIAIGNPGGLNFMSSLTAGVISGLDRKIQVSDEETMTYLQTDAAINEGNSGGALVNSVGQVIGINTAKIAAIGYEGLGFAIPIDEAKEVINMLIEKGYVPGSPWIGIMGSLEYTEEIAKFNNMPMGVYVAEVMLLSPAYNAGLQKDDVITKFDGKPVKSVAELNKIKNEFKPGDEKELEVFRKGETLKLKIVLGEDKG